MEVAIDWIGLIHDAGGDAVLDVEPGGLVGHVVDASFVGCVLLTEWQSAEVGWGEEELGDVRADLLSGKVSPKEQGGSDFVVVDGALVVGHHGEFGCRVFGGCVLVIVRKGYV